MRRAWALFSCLLLTSWTSLAQAAGEMGVGAVKVPVRAEFSRLIPLTPSGAASVSLVNAQGAVAIKRWAHRAVLVRATTRFEGPAARQAWLMDAVIDVQEPAPNHIDVRARGMSGQQGQTGGDGAIDYVLAVPEETFVSVEQEKGPVLAHGLSGRLRVQSREGDIHVSHLTGWADLSNDRGAITVDRISGDLRVASQSGAIVASAVGGDVQVMNNRGDVTVRLAPQFVGELEAHSVNGSFACDGVLSESDHPHDVPGFTGVVRGPLATAAQPVRRIQIDTVRGNINVQTSAGAAPTAP